MSEVHSILRNEDQICCYRSISSSGRRVLWEITSSCNLRCDFCLVEMKRQQLPLAEAITLADALIDAGVDKILLTGGEPLVFKGIEHLVRHIVGRGVLLKLLTNGTVANPAVFDMIRANPGIEVSMSLLSVQPAQADAIFGRSGAFAKLCATLDSIPSAQVNIITAASRLNIGEIAEIIDWVAARGIPGISVINVFKDPSSPARFRDDCRDHRLPDAMLPGLFDLIEAKRRQYEGRLAIRTTQFRGSGCEDCGAGHSVLYVDALGRVLPCTLTENAAWRRRVEGMAATEAIDMYAREIVSAPLSSCSPLLGVSG